MIPLLIVICFLGVHGADNNTTEASSNTKIVGGAPAFISSYPYQVSLRIHNGHFCGGSIISSTWILTAAHCSVGHNPADVTAVVGTNTLRGGGKAYQVVEIIYHSEYTATNMQNDIAVMRLQTPIAYGPLVKPVRLASATPTPNSHATLSGWGLLQSGGRIPNHLQHIHLQVLELSACKFNLLGLTITERQVCTTSPVGQGACNGDSGGPLVLHGTQIGVVSFGIPCAVGRPDVFTSVSAYRGWIRANTGI